MSRRPSPLEQMRALADDGMEAWQIAAALGVRESAVLAALGDTTTPGGAQRAVEDAVSVVPPAPPQPVEEPDTAPVEAAPRYGTPESAARGQQGVQALRDRIRALGVTPAQLRDWAATRGVPCPANGQVPGRVIDAWDAANAVRLDDLAAPDMANISGPSAEVEIHKPAVSDGLAGEFRAYADEVDAVVDAITPAEIDARLAALVGAGSDETPQETPDDVDEHDDCFGCVGDLDAAAEDAAAAHEMPAEVTPVQAAAEAIARGDFIVCMTRCYACQFGECLDPPAWHTWAEKDDVEHAKATGQPDPSTSRCGCSCAGPDPEPELEHVHDPFVAWRENGVPYATCACGETWERQTCTVCPSIVTALWVAQHGPTHKHCATKTATERTTP